MWWAEETRTFSVFCSRYFELREEKTELSDLPLQHRKGAIGAIAASGGISRVFFFFWEGKKKKKKFSYYKNHNQSLSLIFLVSLYSNGFHTLDQQHPPFTSSSKIQAIIAAQRKKKNNIPPISMINTNYIKLVQQTRKELTTQPPGVLVSFFSKKNFSIWVLEREASLSRFWWTAFFLPLAHFERTAKIFFCLFAHNNWLSVTRSRLLLSRISLGFL